MRGWSAGVVLAAVGLLAVAGAATAADGDADVAVIDSGIDPDHDAFCEDQVEVWRDLVAGEDGPYDDGDHGTMVASRVGGGTYETSLFGTVGPTGAYPCVDLHVYKVAGEDGTATAGTINDAVYKAVENGAEVLVVYFSNGVPYAPGGVSWAGAADHAADERVLVVTSAGNDGELPPPRDASAVGHGPTELYPGRNMPDALIVGASTDDRERADFSQRNPEVLAPGQGVPVAHPDYPTYPVFGSGTSFSAPWVAGAAAQLLDAGAPHDPDWLTWVLLHAASDEPTTPYADEGYGVLHDEEVQDALAVARGQAPVPGPDHRDAEHAASMAVRTGMTLQTPTGLLPPGGPADGLDR